MWRHITVPYTSPRTASITAGLARLIYYTRTWQMAFVKCTLHMAYRTRPLPYTAVHHLQSVVRCWCKPSTLDYQFALSSNLLGGSSSNGHFRLAPKHIQYPYTPMWKSLTVYKIMEVVTMTSPICCEVFSSFQRLHLGYFVATSDHIWTRGWRCVRVRGASDSDCSDTLQTTCHSSIPALKNVWLLSLNKMYMCKLYKIHPPYSFFPRL